MTKTPLATSRAVFTLVCAMAAILPARAYSQSSNAAGSRVRDLYNLHNSAAASARAAGDWSAVRRHAAAIDTLLNGNVATMMVIARAAAQLGDTAGAIETLKSVVSMGIVRNLSGDKELAPLHSAKEWVSLVATNESNLKPVGSSRVLFAMPGLDFLAEDIVWDGAGNRYLVSSVRKGIVVAVAPDGTSRTFIDRADRTWGMMALAMDSARGRLWVTTAASPFTEGFQPVDSGSGAVLRFNLRTGALEKRYDLAPTQRGNSPGDAAVSPSGDIFISDSRSGLVYKIRAAADSLEVLVPEGTFMSPQQPALSIDGRTLYIADYSRGIADVDLQSREIRWLKHDRNVALNGIDGLTFNGSGELIAVQNGVLPNRVMALTIDAARGAVTATKVLVQDTSSIREPTHGLVVGDSFHFIANSGWDGFGADGALRKDHGLTPPAVLSIRLK